MKKTVTFHKDTIFIDREHPSPPKSKCVVCERTSKSRALCDLCKQEACEVDCLTGNDICLNCALKC